METILIILVVIAFLIFAFIYFKTRTAKPKHENIKNETYNEDSKSQESVSNKKVKSDSNDLKPKTIKVSQFEVVGHYHVSQKIKKIISSELKKGDELELEPDPNNQYDKKAIKVLFNGYQIGWVPKKYYNKKQLFEFLISGGKPKVDCLNNSKKQDPKFGSIRVIFAQVEMA